MAGVLSVTFSFNQLEEVLKEANKVYPEAFLMLLGSDGRYLVHPDTTVLFRKTIFTDIDPIKQSDIIALGHEMVAGKHGNIHVTQRYYLAVTETGVDILQDNLNKL